MKVGLAQKSFLRPAQPGFVSVIRAAGPKVLRHLVPPSPLLVLPVSRRLGQVLPPPLPRRDGIRVCPEPAFLGTGVPFELRERRVGRRVLSVPPTHARFDECMGQVSPVREDHLPDRAAVPVAASSHNRDRLPEGEGRRELLGPVPERLPLFGTVNAAEPDTLSQTIMQGCDRVTVRDTDHLAAEVGQGWAAQCQPTQEHHAQRNRGQTPVPPSPQRRERPRQEWAILVPRELTRNWRETCHWCTCGDVSVVERCACTLRIALTLHYPGTRLLVESNHMTFKGAGGGNRHRRVPPSASRPNFLALMSLVAVSSCRSHRRRRGARWADRRRATARPTG